MNDESRGESEAKIMTAEVWWALLRPGASVGRDPGGYISSPPKDDAD